jgi:hypothetical protein
MNAQLIARVYADFHNTDEYSRLRLNGCGTMRDLLQLGISLKEGLELRLCMEEVEATGRVTFSEEEDLWVAVVDWDAIGGQHHTSRRVPNDSIVVRGGLNDPATIWRSTAEHPSGVTGISVVCAAGKTVDDLAATVPHSQITTTTVGAVRESGGDVVVTLGKSPFAATLLIDSEDKHQTDAIALRNRDSLSIFADFNNTTEKGFVRLNTRASKLDILTGLLQIKSNPMI